MKEEKSISRSNQESIDSFIKRVFKHMKIEIFDEVTLMFVSDIK